jgi:drug/metabolite transporter (DMT)-like permease
MLNLEAVAVGFGLASAAAWGAGDFAGGLATRKGNVFAVIIVSQFVGALLLSLVALLLAETRPAFPALALGAAAGISGAIGLAALYQGLARSRMSVVAPVAAVTTPALPILVGLFLEGWPSPTQMTGFGLALVGVILLSGAGTGAVSSFAELKLPLVAGIGFGLFYILIDQASDSAVYWPLVCARAASITLLLIFTRARGQSVVPPSNLLLLVTLAGVGDTGGNAFFALATRVGRLDIAAVLSSLYPAVTVLLAGLLLRERLARLQLIGVIVALVALALIAW